MIGWTLQTNRWFVLCHLYFYHLIACRSVIGYRTWHLNSLFRFINLTSKYQFYMHLKSNLGVSKSLEDNVGTLESETFRACFHVCVITMILFSSIREFRSQQISSSTENIYLVKTSVIFTIPRHHGCIDGRTMKENSITYVDGNFTGPIGKEFYVHSGSFKSVWMLCIEDECLRWCGAVMAMI